MSQDSQIGKYSCYLSEALQFYLISMDYYRQKCVWSAITTNQSGNTYQFGKPIAIHDKGKQFDDLGNFYVLKTVNNLHQISKKTQSRLNALKKIQDVDHIVAVNQYTFSKKKERVYLISNYFPSSISLDQFKGRHFQELNILPSKIASIFHSVALALHTAATVYNVSHLRLCPTCILLKMSGQNDKKATWMIRITDFSLGLQNQTKKCKYLQYMHPDISHHIVNPFQKTANQCFKYDIWSYGVMIYQLLFKKIPFTDIPRKSLTKDNCQEWLKSKKVSYNSLGNLLYRCFGTSKPFENWKQVLQQIESKFYVSKIYKSPIKQQFFHHCRLMYLFSQVYIKIREKIHQHQNEKQKNSWVNNNRMQKLSQLLVIYANKFHQEQFKIYFYNRCHILGPKAIKILDIISASYDEQVKYLGSNSVLVKKLQAGLQQKIEDFTDIHIDKLAVWSKSVLKDEKQINKDQTLKIVCQFWAQFFDNWSRSKKILLQNADGDRQTFLTAMYYSKKLQRMAEQVFGFDQHKLQTDIEL